MLNYLTKKTERRESNQIKSIYLSTNQINRVDRTPRKVKPSLTDAPNNRVDITHKHERKINFQVLLIDYTT